HELFGIFDHDAGKPEEILALEIENVIQSPIARILENRDRRGRQSFDVSQLWIRHVRLVFERREWQRIGRAIHPLATRVEIYLPLGKLGGEADVLSILADRERKLILVDDRLDRARGGITEYPCDLGRCQCEAREALRITGPRNNVDPFTAELIDDCLHTRALHADASADGIHRLIA